ncbi:MULTISPECIES: hypothetical protein [unclassified Microbacterium]|uniref:hypothetical protein n=1 Tax=Microbacterium TaxID=33882 RepID=UPI003BA02769
MTRLRRRIAALALAAALGVAVLTPAATTTDAAFTDAEHANATLTALRLRPPQVTAVTVCRNPAVSLLADTLVVQWRWPRTTAPYGPTTQTTARWAINDGTTSQTFTQTGPVDGIYTTTFPRSVLTGLLGGLLGADFSVHARTYWTPTGGVEWSSPERSTVHVDVTPLIAGANCTFTNGA